MSNSQARAISSSSHDVQWVFPPSRIGNLRGTTLAMPPAPRNSSRWSFNPLTKALSFGWVGWHWEGTPQIHVVVVEPTQLKNITSLKTNMTDWKLPIFNRKYIFKWWILQCHVSFPGRIWSNLIISPSSRGKNQKHVKAPRSRDFQRLTPSVASHHCDFAWAPGDTKSSSPPADKSHHGLTLDELKLKLWGVSTWRMTTHDSDSWIRGWHIHGDRCKKSP